MRKRLIELSMLPPSRKKKPEFLAQERKLHTPFFVFVE